MSIDPPNHRGRILQQIADIRARLDPDVLERLRMAASGEVPFDRDRAQDAVQLFLKGRQDGGRFARTLADRLRAERLSSDDEGGSDKPRKVH